MLKWKYAESWCLDVCFVFVLNSLLFFLIGLVRGNRYIRALFFRCKLSDPQMFINTHDHALWKESIVCFQGWSHHSFGKCLHQLEVKLHHVCIVKSLHAWNCLALEYSICNTYYVYSVCSFQFAVWWPAIVERRVDLPPFHAFLMEMGRRANKGQESLCSCGEDRLHSFYYWFPPSPSSPRPWCGWSWRRVFVNYRDCESGY